MNYQPISYHQDFYAWAIYNAYMLKQGKLSEIDVENLIEELEGMAKRDRRTLLSRLAVLLAHLLKWQFEPQRRSKSWQRTLIEERKQVHQLLQDSPSLKHQLVESLADAYESALRQAAEETGLDESNFPCACPYTLAQALDKEFYPE
jgi:Domain of unknown function DUF29